MLNSEKAIDHKIKKYQYIYYKVVRKYRLPTMRNIPFILRLTVNAGVKRYLV